MIAKGKCSYLNLRWSPDYVLSNNHDLYYLPLPISATLPIFIALKLSSHSVPSSSSHMPLLIATSSLSCHNIMSSESSNAVFKITNQFCCDVMSCLDNLLTQRFLSLPGRVKTLPPSKSYLLYSFCRWSLNGLFTTTFNIWTLAQQGSVQWLALKFNMIPHV